MGGLIQETNIKQRKLAGELFDASPTICAMGRQPLFDNITNHELYLSSQNITLILGAFGKSNYCEFEYPFLRVVRRRDSIAGVPRIMRTLSD
eukprot:SAG31_NODE_467_length_15267_cov_13.792919_9_plen_92_part_00